MYNIQNRSLFVLTHLNGRKVRSITLFLNASFLADNAIRILWILLTSLPPIAIR